MAANILKFKNNADLLKFITGNEIQFIDLNFTDLAGKWRHITRPQTSFTEETIKNGLFLDEARLAGCGGGAKAGITALPDISKTCVDPFAAQKTLKIFCDLLDPNTGKISTREPRAVARAAENHLKKSGLADAVYFAPRPEFFIFEDVKHDISPKRVGFEIDSAEGPYNSARNYETGNNGHRPLAMRGHLRESPVDSLSDIRGEMVTVMQGMGLGIEEHLHATAASQCAIAMSESYLLDCADALQIYKHIVRNVANSYGKTATFMPMPAQGDSGSGMPCRQLLWKNSKALFSGAENAGISDIALFYTGGLLKHAKALNAFTNPATNSYKRLRSCGAPVHLAYSAQGGSASCRIAPGGHYVEARFPDPVANPYLAFAAMLMAGLDGIENKIHPGESFSKNSCDSKCSNDAPSIPKMCGSLREALDALKADHEFLLRGDVFNNDIIDSHIRLKTEEIEFCESMVHPAEHRMYYSS